MVIKTNNSQATKDCGFDFGQDLAGGSVLSLFGDLGSGKTTFVKGLAEGLGVKTSVNSPTFNILKLYKIKGNSKAQLFCHIDAYRLNSASDLESLGFQELLQDKNIIIAVEWAEKVKTALPKNSIKIKFNHLADDWRKITISRAAAPQVIIKSARLKMNK